MKGSVWIRVMLWNQCLHITVLNVKLLTMRNYKRERHGDLDTFWGEEGLHNCAWFQLDWTWRKHHCQITSDSLNNFYCVPFHELFTAYISDYYSLLLPAWKFVQPPCGWRCCVSTISEHLKPEPPLRSPIKCNFSQSNLPGLCRDSSHPHEDDTVSTLGLSQHVDA